LLFLHAKNEVFGVRIKINDFNGYEKVKDNKKEILFNRLTNNRAKKI